MAEFAVNGDRIRDAVELIRRQNRVLEHADGVLGEVEHRLAIEGEAKDRIRLALDKARCQVRLDMHKTDIMGVALQEIADAYWTAERKVQEQKTPNSSFNIDGIDFSKISEILKPTVMDPRIFIKPPLIEFWERRKFNNWRKELKLTIEFSHGYLPVPELEVIHFCPLDIGSFETSWKQRSV